MKSDTIRRQVTIGAWVGMTLAVCGFIALVATSGLTQHSYHRDLILAILTVTFVGCGIGGVSIVVGLVLYGVKRPETDLERMFREMNEGINHMSIEIGKSLIPAMTKAFKSITAAATDEPKDKP
jgi:predicted membrane channel-forming protein YqfA (hemolysin III family)